MGHPKVRHHNQRTTPSWPITCQSTIFVNHSQSLHKQKHVNKISNQPPNHNRPPCHTRYPESVEFVFLSSISSLCLGNIHRHTHVSSRFFKVTSSPAVSLGGQGRRNVSCPLARQVFRPWERRNRYPPDRRALLPVDTRGFPCAGVVTSVAPRRYRNDDHATWSRNSSFFCGRT